MKHDSDILKQIKSYFMRRKSAREAHAFEKKVEKDAFLYEAMEGFEGMLTSDIQQAMDELDDRLDSKSNKSLLIINWKMAASVVAILSVGLSLYFTVFNSNKDGNPVSQGEENYQPRNGETTFDTLGNYAFQYSGPKNEIDSITSENELDDTYAVIDEVTAISPTSQDILESVESNATQSIEETVSVNNVSEVESSDDFTIASAEAEPTDSEQIEDLDMDDEAADLLLEEVAEALPAKSEMKRSAPMGTMEKASNSVAATPKAGMANYQSYVKKNLNTSEGMPSGSVILTFELDRNGKPKKISVVKSLCTACDAEAIRVLQNGPEWKAEDKKAKGTVSIKFP